MHRANCENKLLISTIPLAYFYCSRLRYQCRKGIRCGIRIIVEESLLFVWPSLWFLLRYNNWNLSTLPSLLMTIILSTLILYSIYNVGYYYNDYFATRMERSPTIRHEAKSVSAILMFVSHFLVVASATYVLLSIYSINSINIIISYSLIILSIIIHNSISEKINRYASFFILRSAKYIFVPLIFFYNRIELFYIYLAVIPRILYDTVNWYVMYPLTNSIIDRNGMLVYGVFVPFQVLVAGLLNTPAYAIIIFYTLGDIFGKNKN